MTPQEQQLIDGLVERIRGTQVTDKDTVAEQHLQQGLAGYPDAVYVMAQTIIVQQYGLQQAQGQLEQAQAGVSDLQAQLDELRQHATAAQGSGGSFLSHLFGGSSQQAPPQSPPYTPVNNPGYGQSYPPPSYAQPTYPPYAQPAGYAPAGGGFLRGALQTAAGVAAGEMAFASMESLFHGFGGGGGYGSGFGGGGLGEGRPEEVINNYYGDGGEHHSEHAVDSTHDDQASDLGSHNDGFGNDTSSDKFADTQDSNANAFGDVGGEDQNSTGDDSNFGDSNVDDSNFDDSSSDDSGNFGGDDQGSF